MTPPPGLRVGSRWEGVAPGLRPLPRVPDQAIVPDGPRHMTVRETRTVRSYVTVTEEALAEHGLMAMVCDELAAGLAELAVEHGCRFAGPVRYEVTPDLQPGRRPERHEVLAGWARQWWRAWAHPQPRLRRPRVRVLWRDLRCPPQAGQWFTGNLRIVATMRTV